ncbi:MAG TPA: hypothetical protein VEW03_05085 [Longimicrobiaceae bacterium]|nr:hypothetical protein [Longimicrobiaceae bacterium]
MSRTFGGAGLLLLAFFMLLGFFGSGAALGAPATIAALLVTVVLPAAGGVALLAGQMGGARRLGERREQLRRQTREAEVLKLAARRDGRLTAVEVSSELAMTHEDATAVLNALETSGAAEVQITPSGVLVYSFHDIRHLAEKPDARGVLDA